MEHRKRSLRHAILGRRTRAVAATPIEHTTTGDRSIPSGDIISTHSADDEKKIHSRGWNEIFTRLFLFGNILWISSIAKNATTAIPQMNGTRIRSSISSRRGKASDAMKSSTTTKGRILSIIKRILVIGFGLIIIIIFASFLGSTTTSIYIALGGEGYENRLHHTNKGYFAYYVKYRKELYRSFSKLLTLTHGDVPTEYIPQRPRVMSLVTTTTTVHQQRFPHQEQWEGIPFDAIALDPNKIPSYTAKGRTIYVSKKALEKQAKLHNSESYDGSKPDIFEKDDCERLYEWQLTSYPSCNIILEQDMTDLGWSLPPSLSSSSNNNDNVEEIVKVKILGNGYFRDVWKLTHVDDTTQQQQRQQRHGPSYVLKTMRYFHSFSERNYDRHRRDAVATERLTASEHVVDIYAFCGNSGVFQYADGGDLEENVWNNDDEDEKSGSDDGDVAVDDGHNLIKVWNSTEKLLVAYQLAAGVADVHRLNIAHADISHGQFVYVSEEGRFRLNDFNRCRFIRWNKKLQDFCPFKVGSNPGEVSVMFHMLILCLLSTPFLNILLHWILTFST